MAPSAKGKIWGFCPWSTYMVHYQLVQFTVGSITTFRHEIFQLISAFSCAQIYALLADFTCFFQCFYNVTNLNYLMPDFVQLLLCPLPVGPIVNRVNHHFVQLLLCLLPVGSWVNHHFVQLLLCPLLFGSLPFSPLPVGPITICSKYQLVQLPLGPLLVNSIATWSNCQLVLMESTFLFERNLYKLFACGFVQKWDGNSQKKKTLISTSIQLGIRPIGNWTNWTN